MVFGDCLSLDPKLEKGGLRDIPQDQYLQTGGAIGIARDREPPPLPKTTQTPSQEAPSGTETKPSKSAGDSQGGFTHERTQPTNDTPSSIQIHSPRQRW
jgi:hypothetical protein